ncbi:4a-hydroxytetrahydrobiopterin dehydratase [Nocardioides sp. SYSU DS0651]|uniref:4a-hydroxytetrahydrobiopterin dehydratase n=1 Tax=Nocardioides sp. SYSU DS0651 TaxID=3415955 RepID=UPI003F4C4C06
MARQYDEIGADEFARADGVEDWRVLGVHAHAVFRTGSFAAGVALVDRIGPLADAADHHPDVLLTYPTVAVRLTTHATSSLTTADVDLARQISAAARDAGVPADPGAVRAWVDG